VYKVDETPERLVDVTLLDQDTAKVLGHQPVRLVKSAQPRRLDSGGAGFVERRAPHHDQLRHELWTLRREQEPEDSAPRRPDQDVGRLSICLQALFEFLELAMEGRPLLQRFQDAVGQGQAARHRRHVPGCAGTAVDDRRPEWRLPPSPHSRVALAHRNEYPPTSQVAPAPVAPRPPAERRANPAD